LNIKKVYKAYGNKKSMKYNPQNNPGHGNILAGIEGLFRRYETSPEVAGELGVLLSVAKDLSRSYGEIPMETIRELEQRYERLRPFSGREPSAGFRNPCFR
jgi:hypothetical protein